MKSLQNLRLFWATKIKFIFQQQSKIRISSQSGGMGVDTKLPALNIYD
jgi:hypothetical protein